MERDPPSIDQAAVREFVGVLHAAAARALDGASEPGVLQLVRILPDGGTPISSRFNMGEVELMASDAIQAATDGFNVYTEGRTVLRRSAGRGKAGATVGLFAFVDDSDGDKGKSGSLAIQPSLVVETSPGNRHNWIVLDRALSPDEAKPIGEAMRAAVGSDAVTGTVTQPYRVAGTPNYPSRTKRERGRQTTPTRLLDASGRTYTKAELLAAFPPVEAKPRAEVPSGRSGKSSFVVEGLAAETGTDRSAQFFLAIVKAAEAGLLPDDIEEIFRRNPGGCASKYLEPYDRLRAEIERVWAKTGERDERPAETPVEPTYPDHAVPVDEARAAVRKAIEDHLAAGEGQRAIRIATGVGKTRIAAELIAADSEARRAAGDKRPALYAVPRHKLGDEVAALFEAHGVTARVYRGRTADDPREPGTKMCLDIEAVETALTLGLTVSTSCCKGEHPVTGTKVICPSFHACAYQRQVGDQPDVWVVPHQILFQAQAALGKPAHVTIDESFWEAGLWTSQRGLTLDEVGAGPDFSSSLLDTAGDVAAWRSQLARALRRQSATGGVARSHLVAEGLDPDTCTKAIAAEWKLKGSVAIWPGMPPEARRTAARAAKGAKHVRAFARLWAAARELLQQDVGAISGRLILTETDTDEGKVRVVRTRGAKPIAKQWASAPTLVMDATLPSLPVLQQFYPDIEIVADIEATMPFARVRQVLGAPTSAGRLLRSDGERNLTTLRRAILYRFLGVGRQPALVVAQKAVAEWLRASGMPDAIEVAHFNAIAGLDRFKDVRLLIAIGRTLPSVLEVEDIAGAMTGLEPVRTAQPAKGPRWYDKAALGLRRATGAGLAVEGDRHPDATAEALRWQVCEGELIQAIGRARGVNRTATNSVDIELWNNVVLPVTVDEVMRWDDVPTGAEVEMLIDGVVLESPSDMAVCWPTVWETAEGARRWQSRFTSGQIPIAGR